VLLDTSDEDRLRLVVMAETVRPTWGIDEMRAWLQATRASNGNTFESMLEGKSFDRQVETLVHAYAAGSRGFALDTAKLRFPHDTQTLDHLAEGLERGAITGIVIEAYPDFAQLDAIASRLNPVDSAKELVKLERESAVDFLANHFQARGGMVWEQSHRLAKWRTLKWPPTGGGGLWNAFHARAAQSGHDTQATYVDSTGNRTREYKADHAAIYADLGDQPTVKDKLGTITVVFTSTQRIVPKESVIIGAEGVSALAQGEGLTFIALLQNKIDTLTPAEYLALVEAISTPTDVETYPDPNMGTWVMGIDPRFAALMDSGAGGLGFRWVPPEFSASYTRVRSVIR
jgi:hypothetical protein